MDALVSDAEAPRPVKDPHDWNSWENYRHVHEACTERNPFVVENLLAWEIIGNRRQPDQVWLSGTLVCANGVLVDVQKIIEVRRGQKGRIEVRGLYYSYNAYLPGKFTILRYDNGHLDHLDDFHRHEFDLATGQPKPVAHLHRHEMPVLDDFLTEVATIVGFD